MKKCLVCKKEFKPQSHQVKEGTGKCCSRKCSGFAKRGEKAYQWKGEEAGYWAIHIWINKYKPKPKLCEKCQLPKKLEASNNSGKYLRDFSDWEWLCSSCHHKKDGKINFNWYKEGWGNKERVNKRFGYN